jgi:predicted glycoside hydrolase/deacetylase ChbG (UPF0249 family)
MSGLLIVNADDWGGEERSTDAIHEAFRGGLVTSTTAMVYMDDSDRAASIARAAGLPVGLHLNLTQPFTDPATPAPVRERQLRLTEDFAGHGKDGHPGVASWRRWVYDPRLRSAVAAVLTDQLERFEALYGGPPTHFDGHNYVDVCPNVFLSSALPKGSKMRNSLDRYPLGKGAMALARTVRQAARDRRFDSTRYVVHITDLDLPDDPRLQLAADDSIEVVTHPDHAPEMDRLKSETWDSCLARFRTGSFADL